MIRKCAWQFNEHVLKFTLKLKLYIVFLWIQPIKRFHITLIWSNIGENDQHKFKSNMSTFMISILTICQNEQNVIHLKDKTVEDNYIVAIFYTW